MTCLPSVTEAEAVISSSDLFSRTLLYISNEHYAHLPFFEELIKMEAQAGFYEEWVLQDKIKLIEWAARLDGISQSNIQNIYQEDLADAWVEDLFSLSTSDELTMIEIMSKVFGSYNEWPIAERAWLTQMQIKYKSSELGSLYPINLFPDEKAGDIGEKEAITIAQTALYDAFGFDIDAVDDIKTSSYFVLNEDMEYKIDGQLYNECDSFRLWMIRFSDSSGSTYAVNIRNDGTLLSFSTPSIGYVAACDMID